MSINLRCMECGETFEVKWQGHGATYDEPAEEPDEERLIRYNSCASCSCKDVVFAEDDNRASFYFTISWFCSCKNSEVSEEEFSTISELDDLISVLQRLGMRNIEVQRSDSKIIFNIDDSWVSNDPVFAEKLIQKDN